MNEIFFIVLAFLTVFLSVKLSYYADLLSKTSNISKALIGGVLLAGITALPEFVTCFSAISLDNPILALGDVLGSNLFNIFMISFFDLILIKKMFLNNVSRKHFLVLCLLLINYIFIFFYVKSVVVINLWFLSLPSLIILLTYLYYLKHNTSDDEERSVKTNSSNVLFKLFLTAIFMIICSVLLTFTVNRIAELNPSFSGSVIGAILLGITTSLPEVITLYSLIMLNNYDLALSNILGSNLFNLLVLSFGDLFLGKISIYDFSDSSNVLILKLCILFSVLCLFQVVRGKVKTKFMYMIPSIIIVLGYVIFWMFNFVF